jgi:iron complex outermembrane receptor protein
MINTVVAAAARRGFLRSNGHSGAGRLGGLPLAISLLSLVLLARNTSYAQEAASSEKTTPAPAEEVTVTGSRITVSGFNTPTPVTVVSSEQLTQMAPGPLIDAISELPQFYGNQTPQTIGFPSSGGTNLNLRGAGINRTLVLLDGRRMAPSNRYGTVDVATFPEALVKSVETVTGGASATYGSDAVAGVVNYILDTGFTGVKAKVDGGETQYGDGKNFEGSLAGGTAIGAHGHLLLSVDMYRQDSIDGFHSQQDRTWDAQYARVTNPNKSGPNQIIAPYVQPTNFSNQGILMFPGTTIPNYQFLSDGTAVPQTFSGVGQVSGGCNCQALPNQTYGVDSRDEISPGQRRSSAFAYFDYDVTDNTNVYFQGLFGSSQTNLRPTGITLLTSWAPKIFIDNAYLPQNIKNLMMANGITSATLGFLGLQDPNSPVGDDRTIQTNNTGSATIGFKNSLHGGYLDGWHLDGYYQHGESDQDQNFLNGTRVDKLPLGLDAVVNPANGSIVCHAALVNPAQFGNCVPVDLFGGVQNISQEAASYITDQSKHNFSIVKHDAAEMNFNGELWKGFGAGPISGAIGGAYTNLTFNQHTQDPDDEFVIINGVNTGYRGLVPDGQVGYPASSYLVGVRQGSVPSGYLGDNSSATVQFTSLRTFGGGYHVQEGYAELGIPILKDSILAESLSADLAARYANYSGSGGIWAYKAGIDWQVINDIRFRGTYSRDIRAATLDERFDQTRTGVSVIDPQNNNENISTAGFNGGNANLNPEKADTITVGTVFQPTFLSGFQASIDWYSMNIKDAIAQVAAQDEVNACFTSGGTSSECQFVHRDPTGEITRIDSLYINLANQKISGIDLEAQYRQHLNLLGGEGESVNFHLYGSWLGENSIRTPGTATDDRAGQVGTGQSLPRFKAIANLSYIDGPYTLFLQERWISGGLLDRTYLQTSVAIPGDNLTISDNHVSPVFYADLGLTYAINTQSKGDWQVYGQLTNVFNRSPPIDPIAVGRGGTGLDTNTALYDVLGRRYNVGVKLRF